MFKKIFKKENNYDKNILIAALLIHAAKIDENYTIVEKEIIKKAIMSLNAVNENKIEELSLNSNLRTSFGNELIKNVKITTNDSLINAVIDRY